MISKKIINKFKNNYKITYNINTLIMKYMKIKKQEREKIQIFIIAKVKLQMKFWLQKFTNIIRQKIFMIFKFKKMNTP